MKSLHIIDHFCLGGAQRIVKGIIDVIPSAQLLPLHKKGGDHKQFSVPVHRYLSKPTNNLLLQLFHLLQVPHQIRKNQIQIIHCHLHYSWMFGLWLFFVLRSKTALTLFFHEHDSILLTRWYYPFLVRWLNRYGRFIAVSKFIQDRINACGVPIEKVHLVRNYVDLSCFQPAEREAGAVFGIESRWLENRKRIGFAGRLVGYKGWRTVLDLAGRLPEACFLVAGDGTDAPTVAREIRQRGLQERVFLLGYISNMDVFYHQVDVLIIPSIREAFGLVQLEAQACGVPVVIFDSEAAQEIHGDQSSILVPQGDVEMLAGKVQALLEQSDLYAKYVEKGLANARLYDLDDYSEQLNHIYQAALKP